MGWRQASGQKQRNDTVKFVGKVKRRGGMAERRRKGVGRVSKMKNCGNRVEWSFNSLLSRDLRKFDYSPGDLRRL